MGAKPLMVQGTMSGVGKTVLVAGLCRLLARQGVSVAPFKAQNMANEAAVTADGREMGRAQALQAQAARIEPTCDMNPILLKPTCESGSQVVVDGRAIGHMSARNYFAFRQSLLPTVKAAYDRLAARHDVILIEGAGSPVELNLKAGDLCNMGVARLVKSPVLLVGDIDRGGIFAQLAGTLQLLEPDERAMVRATVVNRFRGDASLFEDGRRMLADLTGVPVAGVVPFVPLALEDEDSLSERLDARGHAEPLDVAVIRLPRISNHSDLVALGEAPGIGVRYVQDAASLGRPDLIVLPGSKATTSDLAWLRQTGIADTLVAAAREQTPILGICGGYQMLGERIEDADGSEGGSADGLGLLPVSTALRAAKRTVRATGQVLASSAPLSALVGASVAGYEIHTGVTTRYGGAAMLSLVDERGERYEDGCVEGSVMGCYLHGVLDGTEVICRLRDALLRRRGLPAHAAAPLGLKEVREESLERLADALEASLDIDLVWRIIEEGL